MCDVVCTGILSDRRHLSMMLCQMSESYSKRDGHTFFPSVFDQDICSRTNLMIKY
jgi:hypothetical protein